MKAINYSLLGNISEILVDQIRLMIINGQLAEGTRINEVHLADALGISRTPLREALTSLLAEGALESFPRRGFFVKSLSVEEFNDLYPIRAILDPEALKLSGLPTPEELDALEKQDTSIAAETDPLRVIELDDAWHLDLIKHCKNREMLNLIKQFMQRTRRYEYGLMKAEQNVKTATDIHADILDALRNKDLGAACEALKHNMQHGIQPIIDWLEGRSRSSEPKL